MLHTQQSRTKCRELSWKDEQIGPIPAVEDVETSEAEMAAAAALNANLAGILNPGQPQDGGDIPGVSTLVDEDDEVDEDDDIDVVDGREVLPPIITDVTDDEETTVASRPTRNRTVPARYNPETGLSYQDGVSYANVESLGLSYEIPIPKSKRRIVESNITNPLTAVERLEHVIGVAMVQQFYFQKGIKVFGKKGEEAVKKEFTQMHTMHTFNPVDLKTLSKQEKIDSIASLMFLTQKRDGRVKSRHCADGRKQHDYIKKEDAASPTVALESILIMAAIDAHEGRGVAVIDIPGAFLHAEQDDKNVIMKLTGKLAELMVAVDPKLYRKHIIYNTKGRAELYVRVQRAIYGLLKSVLLFYLKLVEDLERYGFELNPYDPCVANKMINGEQMTVVWHGDNLKVSHKDPFQVTKFAAYYLSSIYGKELTVKQGK